MFDQPNWNFRYRIIRISEGCSPTSAVNMPHYYKPKILEITPVAGSIGDFQ
jgi:hypothetical protein